MRDRNIPNRCLVPPLTVPIVADNISREAAVMTDAVMLYKQMNKQGYFASHDRVDHSEKEYARYEEGWPRDPHQHRGGLLLSVQVRHARHLSAL